MKKKPPSLSDVAKYSGTSISSVSQALRGEGRISDATKKRILKAAKELQYIPDQRANRMRNQVSFEVGILVPTIKNPFFGELIEGIAKILEEKGFLPYVLPTHDDEAQQDKYLFSLFQNRIGGLIWMPAHETSTETYDLVQTHCPAVICLLRPQAGFDVIMVDEQESRRQLVTYLAQKGHNNIAFLGGRKDSAPWQRHMEGIKQGFKENNLLLNENWIIECALDRQQAGKKAQQLITNFPEITAIICYNDDIALGTSASLQHQGLKIGSDIAITGYDDILEASLTHTPLTTIALDPHLLGVTAAKRLLERISEPSLLYEKTILGFELIKRQSA